MLLLAGPTASGKSEIALHLASLLGGEIVSVDSMQVYRGLDIGTAKPSPAERALAPHHLIDVVDLDQPFSVAQFLQLARAAVDGIQARGRLPILCGGTGLYFKAFLEGLGDAPPSDPALRAQLEATPVAELLAELAKTDPEAHARIDRQNPRRVIRALEVIRLTGQPYSRQRADWQPNPAVAQNSPPAFFLSRSTDDLRLRIDARVERMFERGLVGETEQLLEAGLAQNPTAMQALGYRQVVEYLGGVRSLPETIELVKTRTRQFSKRQKTWFRNQMAVAQFELAPDAAPRAAAKQLAQAFREQNAQARRG
jgi:tRNA dimethylallyltransferase